MNNNNNVIRIRVVIILSRMAELKMNENLLTFSYTNDFYANIHQISEKILIKTNKY